MGSRYRPTALLGYVSGLTRPHEEILNVVTASCSRSARGRGKPPMVKWVVQNVS